METCFAEFFEKIENVAKLYKEGASVNEISDLKGIPKSAVSFMLRQSGIEVPIPGNTSNSPSKEEITLFVQLYNDGKNASEIGRAAGYSYKTVLKYLESEGIRSIKPNVTSSDVAKINALYQKGLSSYKVAEVMGVSKPTVLYHLEKKRGMGPVPSSVNSDYFEKIDSPEKAFWLGIMYADGNVDSDGNGITLGSTDKGMVLAFRSVLKSEHNIYTNERSKENPNWKDSHTLKIFDSKLRSDLIKHGCVPNKTACTRWPTLDGSLNSHFIRGLFDGDGSVWGQPGKGYFSITGYLPFLEKIQEVLIEEAGVNKTKLIERKPNYGDIRYGGKTPMKQLYDYLYKDARYFLRRKKEKFEEII